MKWLEAKVVFDFHDKAFAADLISDIFSDFDLQGVLIESTEPDLTQDWAEETPKASDRDAVIGYFPLNEHAKQRCGILEKEVARLAGSSGMICEVKYRELDEEDWAESWKAYFWPERIGENIVVKPTWREYDAAEDDIVLEIDPGMAFGTGTHPTTSLCVRMIERHLKPGDAFLDVGTGSGILMIAAAKLGAASLTGTDSDEVATDIARQNLLLNHVPEEKFTLITGNLAERVTDRFDFASANILAHVILGLLDDITRVLRKDAIFLCSGIIEAKKDEVVEKMEAGNFHILEVRIEEQWVAIAGRYRG